MCHIAGSIIILLLLSSTGYSAANDSGVPQLPFEEFLKQGVRSSIVPDSPPAHVFASSRTPGYWTEPSRSAQTGTLERRRSIGRKVLGAAVGATGGFFLGGFLGAKIEGGCDCDDPGFKGFLIGAPIGAVSGGILGYKFLF
jgi:hypothetical protein